MSNNINKTQNILLGLLIGSLAGATAMLLFAPQSGQRTRAQIQSKSIHSLNRTTGIVKDEVKQIRSDAHKVMLSVQKKAGQLQQLGQDKLVSQMEHVSKAIDAGIAAVETA